MPESESESVNPDLAGIPERFITRLEHLIFIKTDDSEEPDDAEKTTKAYRALSEEEAREADERLLRKKLVNLFVESTRDVVAWIHNGEPISDDELARAFSTILEPTLARIATREEVRIADDFGVSFDLAVINADAAEWARTYTLDLVKGLTTTTRTIIQHAIEKYASTPGMTFQELVDLLMPAFGEDRAETITVTEVTRAYSQAATSYQKRLGAQGITLERVWRTNNDEKVCPICSPLNGQPESA